MRKLFRRKSLPNPDPPTFTLRGSGSSNAPAPALDPQVSPRGQPGSIPEYENEHSTDDPRDAASVYSAALSESDTLALTDCQRMSLQPSYQENFTTYVPYLLRRLRLARQLPQSHEHPIESSDPLHLPDLDDDRTVCGTSMLDGHVGHVVPIMRRRISSYRYKRSLVIASEFIKNTTYVFPDEESFELFRYLRANGKKLRKSLLALLDPQDIARLRRRRHSSYGENSGALNRDASPARDVVVTRDESSPRNHIIPVEFMNKGSGLPLFKVVVPYMSIFRRKTPYMIFRRYIEHPSQCSAEQSADEDHFETYDFCTVHVRTFQNYKRYTFTFMPENGDLFKVLAFQNNYRPFTDFRYKDTRFRVFGTSITMAYLLNYNPEIKLFILDEDQPSLVDNLINKDSLGDLFTKLTKSKRVVQSEELAAQPEDYPNPVPHPRNPIITESTDFLSSSQHRGYIPNEMPPFGRFADSCLYARKVLLLPKRYSDAGKIDLYQDPSEIMTQDFSSTFSVDTDSLVLTTVLMALRETNLRTTMRNPSQAHSSRVGMIASMTASQPMSTNFIM